MTRITILSDGHGNLLPSNSMPEAELLLINGDNVPCVSHDIQFQIDWMNNSFNHWIDCIKDKYKKIIFISGNHCFWAEENRLKVKIHNATYLQDEYCYYDADDGRKLKIYGYPYSLPFFDWAFNRTEDQLRSIYSKCQDADIILNHGMPYNYGDQVPRGRNWEKAGSHALVELIDRVKPKLVTGGHFHSGFGVYQRNETTIVNAALLNEQYQLVRSPIVLEI